MLPWALFGWSARKESLMGANKNAQDEKLNQIKNEVEKWWVKRLEIDERRRKEQDISIAHG